jgi:hypothetical protein
MTKIVISVFERIKLIVISCGEIKDKLLNRILKKQKSTHNSSNCCTTLSKNYPEASGSKKS